MSKSTKEHFKNYAEYLRIHSFSPSTVKAHEYTRWSREGHLIHPTASTRSMKVWEIVYKNWKNTIFIKTEETTFPYIVKMFFHAWHGVCSNEILAPSVTEVLATHHRCCGGWGNIPLRCL